jgi:hypothetical protein
VTALNATNIALNGGLCTFARCMIGLGVQGDMMIRGVTILSALSDVHAWIGLKNSDDQGTSFDLKTELYKNGNLLSTGLTRCITGVTRNPSLAKEAIVPWGTVPLTNLEPGDMLTLRVSTRVGTNANDTKCAGHNNAVGLRLYYDSTTQKSRFDMTTAGNTSNEYLHSDGNACANAESTGVTNRYFDSTAPLASASKCKDSASVNFAGGNAYKQIGEWSMTLP